MVKVFLFLAAFIASVAAEAELFHEKALYPVVLIPGDGGSIIDMKSENYSNPDCWKDADWFKAWVSVSFLEMHPTCFGEMMALEYNNQTKTSHSPAGVFVKVPYFGKVKSVSILGSVLNWYDIKYFEYIINALTYIGYKADDNIVGAPFDFRYGPNELENYYVALKKLITDQKEKHGLPVVLLAHSLGAPLMNNFLNKQTSSWRKENIRSLISLAGAWGGAVKMVKDYLVGEDFDTFLVDAKKVRVAVRTFPSSAFLLPDRNLWSDDEVLVKVEQHNYTMSNIEELLLRANISDAVQIYRNQATLHNKALTAPQVELHCLFGHSVSTVKQLVYSNASLFPDYPQAFYGDGDGTVNNRSLNICKQFGEIQSENVTVQQYRATTHMSILSDAPVLSYIVKYLQRLSVEKTKELGLTGDLREVRALNTKQLIQSERQDLKIYKEKMGKTIEIFQAARREAESKILNALKL